MIGAVSKWLLLLFFKKTIDIQCTVCYYNSRKEVDRMKISKKTKKFIKKYLPEFLMNIIVGIILLIIGKMID